MKKTILALLMAVLVFGCTGDKEQPESSAEADTPVAEPAMETTDDQSHAEAGGPSEKDRLHKEDPAGLYGEALALTETASIAEILKTPESYEGKLVRVEGTVEEVCPRRGCWVNLIEEQTKTTIRVKVVDGDIVFPLSAKGRLAVVEGKVEKLEYTEEQARTMKEHEAEELGQVFDPKSVTGPEVIWRIKGQGAEIKG